MRDYGDFLGRLAARALGNPPQVRPRLPSRFEPDAAPAEIGSPVMEETVETEPEARAPIVPEPRPPAPPVRPSPGPSEPYRQAPLPLPVVHPSPWSGGDEQEEVGDAHVQARPRMEDRFALVSTTHLGPVPGPDLVQSPEPVSADVPAPVSVDVPAPVPVPVFPPPGRIPAPARPSNDEVGRRPESSVPRLLLREHTDSGLPGRVQPMLQLSPPTSQGALQPSPREEPDGREPIGATAVRQAPLRHRSLVPRSTVAREEPDLPFSASTDRNGGDGRVDRGVRPRAAWEEGPVGQASEPTVRVTIGRIEVRATAPAPPPTPAARPTGPRLSLEEYLRRRNGGRM